MKKATNIIIFIITILFSSSLLIGCNINIYDRERRNHNEGSSSDNSVIIPNIINNNENNKYSSKINDEIFNFLKKYYYKELNNLDYINATNKSTEEFLKSFADSYTRITFNESLRIIGPSGQNVKERESFEGYGFTYQQADKKLVVTNILKNGNAKNKLYPKDEIIGVIDEGERVYFRDHTFLPDEIARLLKKDASSTVPRTLIVLRNLKEINVDLYLRPFLNSSIEKIDTKNPNFASIRINKFDEFTGQIFTEYLKELENDILTDETKTLIIDVRNNPGGVVGALSEIVQNLLPRKKVPYFILETENKNDEGQKQLIRTFGGLKKKKPYDIKVLVNGFSASASEILAAVLHYGGGYEIIGEETFGKNVYQDHAKLANGYINITYTRGYWSYYNFVKDKFEKIEKETNPIPVTKLTDLEVYEFFEIPYLKDENIGFDKVNLDIIYIQNFLNYYFKSEQDFTKIRNDGYFDKNTEKLLEKFQQQNNLQVTKILDIETKNKIYDYYLDLLFIVEKDIYYNHILN